MRRTTMSATAQANLAAYWAGSAGASVTTTRKAITTQLREHCEAHGLTYTTGTSKGALVVIIDGTEYTPGQAADRFLSGGFDGSYDESLDA